MPWEKTAPSKRALDPARLEAEVVALCREHIAPLSRYAAGLTQNDPLIQEAFREAFLQYFIIKTSGRTIENPRAWLAHTIKNRILENNRESAAEPAAAPIRTPQPASGTANPPLAFQHALASLSMRERECLRLHIEGYVYQEIAQIMRMKKGAVGALLCDVLKRFRKDEGNALPRRIFSEAFMDTYYIIAHLRLVLAEAQYRKRVQRRVYTYLSLLGLLTAAAAVAAALIK